MERERRDRQTQRETHRDRDRQTNRQRAFTYALYICIFVREYAWYVCMYLCLHVCAPCYDVGVCMRLCGPKAAPYKCVYIEALYTWYFCYKILQPTIPPPLRFVIFQSGPRPSSNNKFSAVDWTLTEDRRCGTVFKQLGA